MIGPGTGAKVMVATRPVDFRKGPDSLAALVAVEYGGTGLCLMAKKMETGAFKWPGIRDGGMRLTAAQLGALLEGLDWRRVHSGRRPKAPQVAA